MAYLVRRLLENGANTSFVNRIADKNLSIESLIRNPVQEIRETAAFTGKLGQKHPSIPFPQDLYGNLRHNSKGLDLANDRIESSK